MRIILVTTAGALLHYHGMLPDLLGIPFAFGAIIAALQDCLELQNGLRGK